MRSTGMKVKGSLSQAAAPRAPYFGSCVVSSLGCFARFPVSFLSDRLTLKSVNDSRTFDSQSCEVIMAVLHREDKQLSVNHPFTLRT